MQETNPVFCPFYLRSTLFASKEDFESYQNLRDSFGANETLRPIPLSYSFEYNQNMEYQSKVLLELIQLHKQKKINLNKSVKYISDFTAYASPLETHFGLFQYIAKHFAYNPQMVNDMIANMDIFGGVLLHEIDFSDNSVSDNIRVSFLILPL